MEHTGKKTHQNRRHGIDFGFVFCFYTHILYRNTGVLHRPCCSPQRVHRIQSCEEDLLAALPTYSNLGCSPWRSVVVRVSSRKNDFRKNSSHQMSRILDDICVFSHLMGNSSVLNLLMLRTSVIFSECSRSQWICHLLFIVGNRQAIDGLLPE